MAQNIYYIYLVMDFTKVSKNMYIHVICSTHTCITEYSGIHVNTLVAMEPIAFQTESPQQGQQTMLHLITTP